MTSEIARMVVRSFKPEVEADKKISPAGSLSARESEILSLLSEGMSNKEIGSRLSISAQTVRSHLMKIFTKLHVHCRTEAAAKYLRHKATLP
jgi:DNA-binding NarL/FixJ family response regulator